MVSPNVMLAHWASCLCFLQEYKLFMRSLEASCETLSMNTVNSKHSKQRAHEILILAAKSNTYLHTVSTVSATLTHRLLSRL